MNVSLISKNFSRSEFACKCGCGYDTVDTQLIQMLQKARDYFGVMIKINSGCRCNAHNGAVGGSKGSLHLIGRAADIVVDNVPPDIVAGFFDKNWGDSIGVHAYKTFTHIDSRGFKARW